MMDNVQKNTFGYCTSVAHVTLIQAATHRSDFRDGLHSSLSAALLHHLHL
jgi:hypothetical protein